jgi:acetyl-CoA C-acetyltransferase
MSVALMAQKLRANPGSKGFCNGNGWFLTKHSLGLYSTTPFEGDWQRQAPSVLQGKIDAMEKMPVVDEANGAGTIESYTVAHVAGKDADGIIIGRMESGERFCAHMTRAGGQIDRLMQEDCIGLKGTLAVNENKLNIFTPDN